MNNRIYYTVILGSLLHDIGKLEQRIQHSRSGTLGRCAHSELSLDLTNRLIKRWIRAEEYMDINLLFDIVRYHHVRDIKSRDWSNDSLNIVNLVCEADNISSSQRERQEDIKIPTEFKLFSIFSEDQVEGGFYDEVVALTPFYWEDCDSIDQVFADDLLGKQFPWILNDDIKVSTDIWHFYNSIYNLLLKTCLFIPDFTQSNLPKTSLFTHLTTTSAIAACMYQYHLEYRNFSNINNKEENKYLLYKGGLSPIQQFLFDIDSENPKGVAKILRGRSFLISIISEMIAVSILYELDLSISNLLQKTGGDFILLLPNTDRTLKVLEEKERKIKEFFWKIVLGKVGYISAYVKVSGQDFSNYFEVSKQLSVLFNRNKNRLDIPWNSLDEISWDIYNNAKDKDFCDFCGIFFADQNSSRCFICNKAELLGGELPRNHYICFNPEEKGIFEFLGLNLRFLHRECDISPSDILVYKYKEEAEDSKSNRDFSPAIYHPISSYLPIYESADKKEFCQEKRCPLLDVCAVKDDMVMTFECMAVADRFQHKDVYYGDSLLGFLKADVDNLGLFLRDKNKDSKFSISEYYQLSFLLDYFFSAVIPYRLQNSQDKYIYVVYSGGDDLLLLGPWFSILSVAFKIRKWFQLYVKNNSSLTLSAGLFFAKPKTPLKWSVHQADRMLKQAKNNGKNKIGISIGGEDFVSDWDNALDEEFIQLLEESICEGNWSRGKVNYLLELRSMALKTFGDNRTDISNYLYPAYTKYMLTRYSQEQEKKQKEEREKRRIESLINKISSYLSSQQENNDRIKNMGLHLLIALARTRRC